MGAEQLGGRFRKKVVEIERSVTARIAGRDPSKLWTRDTLDEGL